MEPTLMLIAVVDDDLAVRKALSRYLRAAFFSVETFGCGAEFIEFLSGYRPDCLLLDLEMKGIGGYEVLRHICGTAHNFPVIIITGHADAGHRQEAFRLGADACLSKPVDGKLLLSTIASLTEITGAASDVL
jgi:FixJ family two-component response regulator